MHDTLSHPEQNCGFSKRTERRKKQNRMGLEDMLLDTTAKAIKSVEYMQTQQVEVELEKDENDVW